MIAGDDELGDNFIKDVVVLMSSLVGTETFGRRLMLLPAAADELVLALPLVGLAPALPGGVPPPNMAARV